MSIESRVVAEALRQSRFKLVEPSVRRLPYILLYEIHPRKRIQSDLGLEGRRHLSSPWMLKGSETSLEAQDNTLPTLAHIFAIHLERAYHRIHSQMPLKYQRPALALSSRRMRLVPHYPWQLLL